MWIWIIVIAAVIGAILGLSNSESGEKSGAATSGAITGAIMAMGCLVRIAIAALSILFVLWLFGQLFGQYKEEKFHH